MCKLAVFQQEGMEYKIYHNWSCDISGFSKHLTCWFVKLTKDGMLQLWEREWIQGGRLGWFRWHKVKNYGAN